MRTHSLAKVFPYPNKSTHEALREDIKNNGLRDNTIYTYKGQIIDGKTRYKVCSELKILGRLKIVSLKTEQEALSILISRNYLRRNLSKSQLAIIGAKLLSRLNRYQRTNEGRKRDSIAKQVGVSSAYISKGMGLVNGYPKLAKLVENAKLSLSEAEEMKDNIDLSKVDEKAIIAQWRRIKHKQAKEKKEETERLRKQVRSKYPNVTDRYSLHCADIKDLGEGIIKPNSLDFIFCDPPYLMPYQDCYKYLGQWAKRNLKPNGVLIALSHSLNLDLHIRLLSESLTYKYLIAIQMTNKTSINQVPHCQVRNVIKPAVIFTKSKNVKVKTYEFIRDLYISDLQEDQKTLHHWGQSPVMCRDFIKAFCVPGGVVADPFLGSGSTLIGAIEADCRFIGADIDQSCISATLDRVNKMYGTKAKRKVA